jgi:hypothetical protein
MSELTNLPLIEEVLNDPAASNWLKNALMAALQRDAVDAANDSALLAALLDRRADALLACCRLAATDGTAQMPEEIRRSHGPDVRTIH